MTLHFDPATHTYTVDGRRVPSVTEILKPLEDYSMVPRDILEAAREFGQHVHLACHLYDSGQLDWSSLDAPLVPYVEGWKKFLADTGAVVIASEFRVYHEQLGYAGSPDKALQWGSRFVLPDLKATAIVPPTVGCQTAGYAKAYQSMYGGKEPERYCIHLTGDGLYSSHQRKDPADWSMFVSALNCHKFREKHRVRIAA